MSIQWGAPFSVWSLVEVKTWHDWLYPPCTFSIFNKIHLSLILCEFDPTIFCFYIRANNSFYMTFFLEKSYHGFFPMMLYRKYTISNFIWTDFNHVPGIKSSLEQNTSRTGNYSTDYAETDLLERFLFKALNKSKMTLSEFCLDLTLKTLK